ncbi:MAG: hypothetical protein H6733_08595 [Alphaproteobacteria bacterium]|nr:hypothetical protein [Alphaproteobacteria bacterium]
MRRCLPWLVLAACQPPTPPDVEAVFDPGGAFFDAPFPSDARRTSDGGMDWSGFPNPAGNDLFAGFLERASARPGAATDAPVYVRFDVPIDPTVLPTAEASTDPSSSVQLLDVTPGSPTFGERTPVWWEVRDTPGAYVPEHLLAVAPVPGFTLRPRTTYALVITTALAGPSPAFTAAWDGDGSAWGDSLALLREAARKVDLDPRQVAVATTFTTSDPTEELDTVVRFLRERVDPPTIRPTLEAIDDIGSYHLYRSDYTTPLFMSGDKPYDDAGGTFVYRDDGLPQIQGWDAMRLAVTVPRTGTPPPGGWPVVVYLHGTGGNFRNFADSASDFEVANWLGELGVVGLGIDLPLHGPRGTSDTIIELHSFNVLQPDSALYMHRQAAIDALYLLEGLTRAMPDFVTPDGTHVPLDPDRIVLMGHSQGGITSALALPWVGDRVRGVMLSGTGGLLAITAVERDADFDFPTLIRGLLQFDDDEALTELHPVLGLVQSLVEVTDPINYAPFWFHEDHGLDGAQPTPVLLTTGLEDAQTPTRTSQALASSARMPFAGRVRLPSDSMGLRGFVSTDLPVSDDVTAWNGDLLTAGFSQWEGGTHFVIFEDAVARDTAAGFVTSALRGSPEISRKPPEPADP